MIINRKAYKSLLAWKKSKNRKPLLIRGARQVGKTTLVREFAKEFDVFVELNLERESDKKPFLNDDVSRILDAACLLKGVIPKEKSLLLFLDEIQESPKALQMLRFFNEDRPDIYVVAAGSLLEFSLKKVPSFPVGRIEYLYLHPLNFEEFLHAKSNLAALDTMRMIPVSEYANEVLLDLFHEYAVIGGMPGIVRDYLEHRNISSLVEDYNQLWQAYRDDVEKYGRNETDRKIIRHILDTASNERDRIKFEGFGNSSYRSREVGEAIRSLEKAKIIRLIHPSTDLCPPIINDLKKRPRLQLLDTGLLNYSLDLQGEMLVLSDLNDFYKGKLIQHIATQELISVFDKIDYKPNFWVRESKNSNSEVDLIFNYKNKYVIPIEIKSGKQGRLKSLHQFIERVEHNIAIRLYSGKFSIENSITPSGKAYILVNIPYYHSSKIVEYIDYIFSNEFVEFV